VYDLGALRARVAASGGDAAFVAPPASAFYAYSRGRASPYGEQAAALLRSLAEAPPAAAGGAGWSAEAYAARNFDAYAGGGIFRTYVDGSTRGFMRRARAGALPPATGVDDDQANAYARLPPLVAALAGDAALLPAVRAAVRVTQRSPLAVACACAAARLLDALICGTARTLADAVRDAADACEADEAAGADALRAALARAGEPHADAVNELGRNCHLPGSLSSAVHALLAHGDDYAAAVRATIAQGGCNASRAGFVGACLAALHGAAAVPAEWVALTAGFADTAALADAALGLPPSPAAV
jgi:ADP-ribosylglycohydrolase